MKTISVLITLVFLFTLGTGVLAQTQETELPNPGLTPDSPFYFLETISEEIVTLFTFGDLKKAERYFTLAEERLSEAQVMIKENKPKRTEKTLERYGKQLGKSLIRAEKADAKGKDTKELAKVVTRATYKHLVVLNRVLEKVPEEEKSAIEQAMTASIKGHETAVGALRIKGALGEVPEGDSLPAEISANVRARIQNRAQEELQKEQVEREIEKVRKSDESLRELCAKSGAPPEQCDALPEKGFKSFDSFKNFCLEMGGSQEVCATLEATCRQLGIKSADVCSRALMSTSRVSTSPRPHPAE